jgi:Protein of unknown function (DUF3800)
MSLIIYLDESGDLGWNFTAPYRNGGSSRYLTIGALCTPTSKKHFPKRVIKSLYRKFKWNVSIEKKWSDMTDEEREEFSGEAFALCKRHPDIQLFSITVRKQNVQDHIRTDGNKLYNYMIRLSLLNLMSLHPEVTMVPDPRSIKVESGRSLHDYLQIELWFQKMCKTILATNPAESHQCLGIQFADMLCGAVQAASEDSNYKFYRIIAPCLRHSRLFFG